MRLGLTTQRLLAAALVVLANGCVYEALGQTHTLTAAERLFPGMPQDMAVEVLSQGGTLLVDPEITGPPAGNWAAVLSEPAVVSALAEAERSQGKPVQSVLHVARQWGFMGFGSFHLFLDANAKLVGYHVVHVN